MNTEPEPEAICNLCGLTCAFGCETWHANHGLLNQEVSGGYESTPGNGHGALDDCTSYRFSLCEFCLDHLFSQFKIPVATSYYDHSDDQPKPWRPAAQRVAEDDWRKMKDEFLIEKNRRDDARRGLK